MSSTNIIKYDKFQISNLSITELSDAKYTKNFYVNYDTSKFSVQTPISKIDFGGIPREDDFHTNDESRCYIKIALDANKNLDDTRETKEENELRNKNNLKLKELFNQIDTFMQSDETKKKLFGKDSKQYIYTTIVKAKNEDITDDRNNPEFYKIKFYWKNEEDGNGPSFKLFKKTKTGESSYERESVDTNEITDVDYLRKNYIGYMRDMKFIISFHGWANKKPKGKGQPMSYGVSIRLIKVEVEEKNKTKQVINSNEFIDDSDEEIINKKLDDKLDDNDNKNDDDDDDDDNENDDDDDDDDDDEKDSDNNNSLDNNIEEFEVVKPKRRTKKNIK